MLNLCGRQAEEIKHFADILRLSGQPSVDAFLERRPEEFLQIGKEAIACALAPLENEGSLFDPTKRNHWYRYLFNKMQADSLGEFGNNKISFITFNYDRSLEHFLFVSLKHSYGRSDAETAEVLRTIPIIHVYGQLGKYLPLDKTGRQYGNQVDSGVISRCVAEIKIAHESASGGTFSKAHEVLGQAEKVCFLGFGYYRINLERLQLSRVRPGAGMYIGTAHGLEDAEMLNVRLLTRELGGREVTLYGYDVYTMLRKVPVLSRHS